jgi:hypothetical protein
LFVHLKEASVDVDKIVARRNALQARHEVLESVPGSGWHKDDTTARNDRDVGLPPLSRRFIAVCDDDRLYFCGPDCAQVRLALAKFAAEFQPEEDFAIQKFAKKMAERYAATVGDVIEMPTKEFNGVAFALNHYKLPVCTVGING